MTERAEQWICFGFHAKLEHPSAETLRMMRKAAAVDSCWLAASSQQCARPLMHQVLCRVFSKTSRWLSPATAQSWCPVTSDFSQNKNHLWKGRDFRSLMRFRKIWWGSWWWLGELGEIPRCLLWRGLSCPCPIFSVFTSCTFFNKCLCFSCYMSGYLLDRLFYIYIHINTHTHTHTHYVPHLWIAEEPGGKIAKKSWTLFVGVFINCSSVGRTILRVK